MSLIETGRPLLRITRETTVPCPDTDLRFIAEPPSSVYSLPAGSFVTVNLLDEDGNFLQIVSYTQTGSTFDVVVDSDTPIVLNGTPLGDVKNWTPIAVNLEDSVGNPVAPVSSSLVGNILTVTTNPNPSGIYFPSIYPDQHTSFRTGDEGWRFQNNWWDRINPALPSKFAELDLSLGVNAWWRLKSPLTVGGVSSTVRFVDVDGLQIFSSGSGKNLVVIDKLTGLMYARFPSGNAAVTWANAIDNALAYSVTVNSIIYDDWFLACVSELCSIFNQQTAGNTNLDDGQSAVRLINIGGTVWTSNTYISSNLSANTFAPNTRILAQSTKTSSQRVVFVRKAYNLIS
jgi:hypothetical protein